MMKFKNNIYRILILITLFNVNLIQSQDSPNILFIIADDIGIESLFPSDYGININTEPTVPYLEELKNDGISYLNTWATPLCTTSRASIMSGKYGVNSGVIEVPDNLDLSNESIFNYLNNNQTTNYKKAVIGKWHISDPLNLNHPYEHGVDYYEGVMEGSIDNYYSWDKIDENGNTVEVNEYVTKHFTDLAKNWISNQTEPWFLWLAHIAPHSPFQTPPSGTYSQTDVSNNRGNYLASIEALDYYIGDLLNSMDQDTRDNTIIVFIGDNGTPNGVARFFPDNHNKSTLYEGGIRVPMIISGKGVTRQGVLETGLTQVNDIYATIIETVSNDLEGGIYNSYSIKESFTSENTITRPFIYSDFRIDGVKKWAIRNKTYKLIEDNTGNIEFYNVVSDIEEKNNLVGVLTSDEEDILNELRTEASIIRNAWSCKDEILNGHEITIDDTCTTCGSDASTLSTDGVLCTNEPVYDNIYYEYYENDLRKVYSNSYPNHKFAYRNQALKPVPSYHALEMDLNPTNTGMITNTLNKRGRPATAFGVALNGVMFVPGPALPFVFLNTETNEYNWDWVLEPTNNKGIDGDKVYLDCASAHTSIVHGYHYHGEMFEYLEEEHPGITSATSVSEVVQIGWAADGFPIVYKFGPDMDGNIVELQSSYKLKDGERPGDGIKAPCGPYTGKYTSDYEYSQGLGDLDECNGIASSITLETESGTETFDYFYVVTSNFPQIPRCFVGNINDTFANDKIDGIDNDGDGFIEAFDCDDTNATINPLAEEIPGNGIDENCDGNDTLSIEDYDLFSIKILPNPSSSFIRLVKPQNFNYDVNIYDIRGKKVLEKNGSPEFINVSKLSKGVYFLKINKENLGNYQILKFIKK